MSEEIDIYPSGPQVPIQMTKLTVPDETMKFDSIPFLSSLNGVKLTFIPLRSGTERWNKAMEHYDYVLKRALNYELRGTEVLWGKMNKRLARSESPKKNSDVSLGYRIGNMYLTKKCFTFGLRRTEPGECHIYQTDMKALLFYLAKSFIYYREKTFQYKDRSKYDCYILKPKSKYLVRDRMVYLIVTMGKSLFQVDFLSMSDVEPSDYKDPTGTPFREQREDVISSHSRQLIPDPQMRNHSAAATPRALQETDSEYLQTENPSTGQPLDNNVTMSPVENSIEAPADQPTPNSEPADQPATSRGGPLIQSKKRRRQSTGEEVNVGHSPSHRNNQLVTYRTPRKSSDRCTQTSSDTRQQETTESANSSTLTETPTCSSEEVEPSSYEVSDYMGNKYEYKPINMNWGENEPLPLSISPFMKHINGRCYMYVPIKNKLDLKFEIFAVFIYLWLSAYVLQS